MKPLFVAFSGLLVVAAHLNAQSSSGSDPASVVRRVYQYVNRHNADSVVALYADTLLVLPPGDSIVHRFAKPSVRDTLQKFFTEYPRLRIDISLVVNGPFVGVHERISGLPGITENGLDVYEVQDGRVLALWELPVLPARPR